MKKTAVTFYNLIRWSTILLLFLLILTLFVLESPATVLNLIKIPLKSQGISYGEMEGGIISGFRLKDLNYKNEIKADEVALKINFEALQDRILVIDHLILSQVEIEKNFLTNIIDTNHTDEADKEGNISLPFDTIVVKNAEISLKDTGYQNYYINNAQLQIRDLETDMKREYKGRLNIFLDSNMTQADIRVSFVNEQYDIVGKIEGNQDFLNPFIAEHNITLLADPKLNLEAKGDLTLVNYKLTLDRFSLKQNSYIVKSRLFETVGSFNISENSIVNQLKTELDGNMAYLKLKALTELDLDDLNNSLTFDIDGSLQPKKDSIPLELAEQDITIQALPKIQLLAKGTAKKVNFSTTIKGLKAEHNGIDLNIVNLRLKGDLEPLNGEMKSELFCKFKSSVASGNIALKSRLNYKDINNTLTFDLESNLKSHKKFLSREVEDLNLTIKSNPLVKIVAKGSFKKIDFDTEIKNFRATDKRMDIDLKIFSLKGRVDPLKGDTDAKILAKFDSSMAEGEIDLTAKLNFKDVNNSLHFTTKSGFKLHNGYVNNFLEDSNISLEEENRINIKADGDTNKIYGKILVESQLLVQNIDADIRFNSENIVIDLKKNYIKGDLALEAKSTEVSFDLKSRISGDYLQPKAMQMKSKITVSHFDAFNINLNTLTPLVLDIKSGRSKMVANLESKKLHLHAESSDLDEIQFDIKSSPIYLAKIVQLPDEFKENFIAMNLRGDATLSKQYFNLKGYLKSNKNFKLKLNAKNSASGLDVRLKSGHLKLKALGNLEKRNIDASISIDSISKVQEEFAQLYPFRTQPIDGEVSLLAKVRGDHIFLNLSSPKVKMKGFNLENMAINVEYTPEVVTLHKFNLETTGFKDSKLNKKIYLNKKGKIYLGKRRDIFLDIHPKILVDIKGTESNLKGSLKVNALPLGHPDYGKVILTTDIKFNQKGKKKHIRGKISLKKMKLLYEAKFLDPAYDPDVVIVDKNEKKSQKDDSFIEDTSIDLLIYAPDAEYETKDIKLTFAVDLKAKKEFGKNLGMFGKIKEINGRVEQAPKLFNVVDSSIVFRGLKEINPLLDIEVQHELPDVLIFIDIHGDAKRPKLEFSSDPQMPKKDILSYLLLGVSTAKLANEDTNLGREAELFIMNQAARDLAYEIELDRVFIKDDGTGEGYAIQVGKKINEKSMFVVESSKEGNSFILEYDLNKNIKIELGQHQKTIPSQSIDIFFRKRFK